MNGQWSPSALVFEFFEVGNYSYSGLEYPASGRDSNDPSVDGNDVLGFRVTLYL